MCNRQQQSGGRAEKLIPTTFNGQRRVVVFGIFDGGINSSGLTFYDDEVTDFFSPHAEGKSVMFLVALGKRARRRLVTVDTSRLRSQAGS